jgi:hypothetical protein
MIEGHFLFSVENSKWQYEEVVARDCLALADLRLRNDSELFKNVLGYDTID